MQGLRLCLCRLSSNPIVSTTAEITGLVEEDVLFDRRSRPVDIYFSWSCAPVATASTSGQVEADSTSEDITFAVDIVRFSVFVSLVIYDSMSITSCGSLFNCMHVFWSFRIISCVWSNRSVKQVMFRWNYIQLYTRLGQQHSANRTYKIINNSVQYTAKD